VSLHNVPGVSRHSSTSPRQRGYTSHWDVRSRNYRKRHPLCVMCLANGIVAASEVVDHKKPHHGAHDPLMWDEYNMQALCKRCHDGRKQQQDRLGYDKAIGLDGWPTHPQHPANKKFFS
jgi:5-methylcytosine-specific restriction protein A